MFRVWSSSCITATTAIAVPSFFNESPGSIRLQDWLGALLRACTTHVIINALSEYLVLKAVVMWSRNACVRNAIYTRIEVETLASWLEATKHKWSRARRNMLRMSDDILAWWTLKTSFLFYILYGLVDYVFCLFQKLILVCMAYFVYDFALN